MKADRRQRCDLCDQLSNIVMDGRAFKLHRSKRWLCPWCWRKIKQSLPDIDVLEHPLTTEQLELF